MKNTSKLLSLILALVMVFSFAACGGDKEKPEDPSKAPASSEAPTEAKKTDGPEIRDVTGKFEFSEFSFKVNGKELKNADFKDAKVYKITVETVNSKGNSSEATYSGYAIRDVLKAAGVENATKIKAVANDGYEVEYTITDENAPYSLLAIEKDKEVSGDGTVWFAPCLETVSQNFARSVVEIVAE